MKKSRLTAAIYIMLLTLILVITGFRLSHQLSAESSWRLFSFCLLAGSLIRLASRLKPAKV